MGYVSANRGFKSGGFNGRANTVYDTQHAEYDPEYVWTYEVGLKASSADNRLRGSVAAFKGDRSEEHTSELQSLMRISYAVFCLKKKNTRTYNFHKTKQTLPTQQRKHRSREKP